MLKIVTADQVQHLALPHLSFKHTQLPEPKPKSARNKSHRNAAGDLAEHRQVVQTGFTEGGDKLWQLTTAGLEAVVDRPQRGRAGQQVSCPTPQPRVCRGMGGVRTSVYCEPVKEALGLDGNERSGDECLAD